MMQKWIVVAIFFGICMGPVSAQTDPNIHISQAQEQPSSSIDLLQQATKKSSPFASPKKAPKVPKVPPAATTEVSTDTAKIPAKPAADQLLDMPLPIGGSTTTVQTQVAPVPKPRKTRRKTAEKSVPSPTVASTITVEGIIQPEPEEETEEDAADAELEYAVKMLEKSKQDLSQGRTIPPAAAKNKPGKVPAANKKFNPSAFRPGVEWVASKSTHFDIYTQKSNGQIGSANMAMVFETAYDTLRRFIPWMMSGRVRVFVYQDHDSYLRYEPEAKAWSGALAYPTRGEIAVYDQPGKMQEIKTVFAHELTHIFTQQFFDKHKTGRIMTPAWLDEGLAVLVEDQMFTGRQGGPWDNDYRTLLFERDPRTQVAQFGSSKLFGDSKAKSFVRGNSRHPGKPVRLLPFEEFMQEGSLDSMSGKDQIQKWYLQAYLMVRFLLSPEGGNSPSNRMQFEQFTRLIADGEAVRDPETGFLIKDARGKQVYEPYDVQKALGRVYRYNTVGNFEDNFWRWLVK